MRWLANENFPGDAVELLRAHGHDVAWIRVDSPGLPDPQVLARAVTEQRVLLTFDKDFGELAFRSRLPAACGVILFRFTHRGREQDIGKVVRTLTSRDDWAGAFWTVTDRGIRRRDLPK